jgi:hypothetical protein
MWKNVRETDDTETDVECKSPDQLWVELADVNLDNAQRVAAQEENDGDNKL